MTEQTRARAIEILSSPRCKWTIESATEEISQQEKRIAFWENRFCWESKYEIADAKGMIELLHAIIAILMERKAEQEAMENINSCYGEVSTSHIRKVVAIMANKLRKAGISLSSAFKQAWNFVKFCVGHKHLIKKLIA